MKTKEYSNLRLFLFVWGAFISCCSLLGSRGSDSFGGITLLLSFHYLRENQSLDLNHWPQQAVIPNLKGGVTFPRAKRYELAAWAMEFWLTRDIQDGTSENEVNFIEETEDPQPHKMR